MDDLVSDLLCEATDGVAGLQSGLTRLVARPDDGAAVVAMLHRLHALKGVCGFVGFSRAETLAHAGESLLAGLGGAAVSSAALVLVGDLIQRLSRIFTEAGDLRGEPEGDDGQLISDLEAHAVGVRRRAAPGADAPLAAVPASLRPISPELERRARAPWAGLDTLARALGDRLGKRIDLVVGGDDVRIAPAAAAPLRTALIALVRNACDHGVETPGERRLAAKPALSLLRLSVQRNPDGATVELADDGRGVDPVLVRAGCVASGRLDAEAAAAVSDAEAQALIFTPGVTTAKALTSLSGRGLGLELVRLQVEAIGGLVGLNSTPGRGARFVLRLPASALASAAARSRVAA